MCAVLRFELAGSGDTEDLLSCGLTKFVGSGFSRVFCVIVLLLLFVVRLRLPWRSQCGTLQPAAFRN